jgi:hypothetical protein
MRSEDEEWRLAACCHELVGCPAATSRAGQVSAVVSAVLDGEAVGDVLPLMAAGLGSLEAVEPRLAERDGAGVELPSTRVWCRGETDACAPCGRVQGEAPAVCMRHPRWQ